MKTIITITLLTLSFNLFALKSPFPSTVSGIDIPNTHVVDTEGRVLRGMAPKSHIYQLIEYGITDVLIFKNQTNKEVDKEIVSLKELGFSDDNIHHIDFRWKDFISLRHACEKTIGALKVIKEVMNDPNRALFFHCTVGEDRTGYLAGIYRMLNEFFNIKEAFEGEVCGNGFGASNPNKPFYVVNKIRGDLRTLFILMAVKVESGELSFDNLNYKVCNFNKSIKSSLLKKNKTQFKCTPKTLN